MPGGEKEKKSLLRSKEIFNQNHGFLRTSQALRLGIAPATLYEMVTKGFLVKESRGLYRLCDIDMPSQPTLVIVSLLVPKAVICLLSALKFHDLTSQIPQGVYFALPKDKKKPKIDYPPIEVIHLSEEPYNQGIEVHNIDGINIRVYSREKTIADCFRFRNRIGINVAIEALKDYLKGPGVHLGILFRYARVNRVEIVMRPYVESLI